VRETSEGFGCLLPIIAGAMVLMFLLTIAEIVEGMARPREDASGRRFLCWEVQIKNRPLFANLRHIEIPENCIAVDHYRSGARP
jgi:hypothetical protein